MKMTAKCTAFYRYPVELVWRSIGAGGDGRAVDPLQEEEYLNSEPGPGMVFTRSLEVKPNEVFSFQIKSAMFYTDWRLELKSIAPCETKVVLTETMEYRSTKAFFLCGMGLNLRREVRAFARDLGKKVELETKKM